MRRAQAIKSTGHLGVLAAMLLAAAIGCERGGKEEAEREQADGQDEPVAIRAEPAELRTIDEIAYGLGRCEALPERLAALTPAMEGRVLKILAAQGDAVRAGQPIVELDPSVARANLNEKTATRQSLEASLRLLRALPRPDERKSLELAIDQAKAAIEKAESAVGRLRPLRERGEVSAEQVVQAELSLRQAQLQQQSAQTQLDIAMLGPRPQAVDEAQTKIAAASAACDSAQAQLDLHTIRSPIAGVLDRLACHPGQTVAVGASIGEVVDGRQVVVIVGLSVADAREVRAGQLARITAPDTRDWDHATPVGADAIGGKVLTVGRIADAQTGNLPVRILADNPQGKLTVGQIAAATIVIRENTQRLAVPAAAIHDIGEGPVLSIIRDGKAVALHTQLGVRDARWVEVLGTDLRAGELVVTEGGYNLPGRDGGDRAERGRTAQARNTFRARGTTKGRGAGRLWRGDTSMITAATPNPSELRGGRRNLVFLARPYFGVIVLLTAVLAVFGVVSMLRMPSGIYPEVAFPRITVVARTTGMAVREVEISVTRPIEEATSVVLGVRQVRSKTIRGSSEVDIDFAPGTDMIQALNDVRAKIAEVGVQFPAGTSTIVERQTPSIFPIISFVVLGGNGPRAPARLRLLRPPPADQPDQRRFLRHGPRGRHPGRSSSKSLPTASWPPTCRSPRWPTGSARSTCSRRSGGWDRGTLQYQVMADSQVRQAPDLENVVIAYRGGQPVRLGDVGRVTISHEDRTMAIRSFGQDAVAVTVFRRLGGDALAISRDVDEVLADARRSAPPGVRIVPVYDQATLVRTSVGNVRDAILIGGALSVLILLVFLKSLRATLLTALAIPLSLVISFVFLYLTRDTLNLMSLGGLAVAIGLIIDDSVVVVENIARHLSEGGTGDEAVERASREISGAVIGSTLTTILVFVPLAMVRGGDRAVLPIAEPGAVGGPVGLDGGEPDADPRAGGQVPGASPDAGQRGRVPVPRRKLRGDAPRRHALAADCGVGRNPDDRPRLVAVSPTEDRLHARHGRGGLHARLLPAGGGRRWPRLAAPSGVWKRSSPAPRTCRATSAGPGRRWVCSPPKPSAATSW